MTGVIYARYSSDNQREESIEGQLRECKAFAEKNGITLIGTYIDRALSAKTDNRPDFQRMIKDSAKQLFDVVIVWKLDRFTRNRYDSAQHKNTLKKNGVKVVSATEQIADDSTGILIESILEGYAEYYSAELSEKVKRGLTENALKGKYNGGGMPMGLIKDSEQRYQIDPVAAPVVLEAFKLYAEGSSMREVRDWMNEQGITTKHGNPININFVTRLLNNRRYMGEYSHGGIVQEDTIPAIVPKDLFDRVQKRMAKNKKAPAHHKAEDDYLLTTKLYCGCCKAFMVGESGTSRTKKVHHYYKCVTAKKRLGCPKKTVRKKWIEDIVVDQTMRIVMDDGLLERITDMVMELQEKESSTLPLLRQQLAEAERGIQNMVNAIQQGIITPATKQRLDELEATKSKLETAMLQEELEKPRLTREQVSFWLHRFRKLDLTQQEHRRRLIDSFVNAIYLYDDKLVLIFNYKDGTRAVSFEEIEQAYGSDFTASAAPPKNRSNSSILGIFYLFERRICRFF